MGKQMNPPKRDKYPTVKPKEKTFFEKHEKAIKISAFSAGGLLILAIAAIIFCSLFFAKTPYNGINIKKYAKIPDYKGIELSEKTVSEAVETEKKKFLRQYATFTDKTSGVINEGDNVTISTKGYYYENGVRGNEVTAGGSLSEYEITDIGNHITESGEEFSPEIQEALIGTDFVFTPSVTALIEYPETYGLEEFNGKTVQYVVTILKVTETHLPEYTDELIKEKTGLENIAEYEKQITKEIEENLLWNTLSAKTEFVSYPQKKIEKYAGEFEEYYRQYMSAYGLSFADLLADVLMTDEDGYYAQRDAYAKGTVEEELILYGIVKKERMKISKSEYNEKCKEYAAVNGYDDVDSLIADYTEEVIRRTIYWEKVKTLMRDSAARTE